MTTQSSPGPWTVAAHTAKSPDEITPGCDWTIYGADNVSVCFEGSWNKHANANVRLITAAPDLLEALIDSWNPAISSAERESKARAAIAKATGNKS